MTRLRVRKNSAGRAKTSRHSDVQPPVIGGKVHRGTWTLVGSGRLGTLRESSDIDYMVPLEEVREHLHEFIPYKGVQGVYWKVADYEGRDATVVAVPRAAYDIIDESYQSAVDQYSPRQLQDIRDRVGKDQFYKAIGVVYTDDAMSIARARIQMVENGLRARLAMLQNEVPEVRLLTSNSYFEAMRDLGALSINVGRRKKKTSRHAHIKPPVIGGKPHAGTWTLVGSGRLGILRPKSDIDYMVPIDEVQEHLSEFLAYKGAPGVFWKPSSYEDRDATIVAVPRAVYEMIDDSMQKAVEKFQPPELRRLRNQLGKTNFYRHLGVIYTDDAIRTLGAPDDSKKQNPAIGKTSRGARKTSR